MSGKITDMGASIRQRLKNKGRELGLPFDQILQRYAIERFLYRLSKSQYVEMFILKGAQMLVAWGGERTRPTKDIDLMGFTESSLDNLKSIAEELCGQNRQDLDGIMFDPDTVTCDRIKEDADYEGVRVVFDGKLDTATVHIQIDIGFNDALTPGPEMVSYPSLLGFDEPKLKGYNRETLIAEKYEAMVKLGELNSRMKDFFDIWLLSIQFSFEGHALEDALQATFKRRGSTLGELPTILSVDFERLDEKQKQWKAFLRKSNITYAPAQFSEVSDKVSAFIGPVLKNLHHKSRHSLIWSPSGPWIGPT